MRNNHTMINDPSITALRALKSIERTGSVSKTAIELGLTQSAVSRSIATYEKSLGLDLLRRDRRPLILTKEGELVVSHALEIDRSILTLNERLRAVKQNKMGTVTIGSFGSTASTHILPSLLTQFTRIHPEISISIQEQPDDHTRLALINETVDVAVLSEPVEDFEAVPIAADQLVALIHKSSPLYSQSSVAANELEKPPFIMTLAGSEPLILDWFNRGGVHPNIRHRIQQTNSIIALVQQGFGNAIVTSLSLPQKLDDVKAIPLCPSTKRQIYLVKKIGSTRSNATTLFWKFVEQLAY